MQHRPEDIDASSGGASTDCVCRLPSVRLRSSYVIGAALRADTRLTVMRISRPATPGGADVREVAWGALAVLRWVVTSIGVRLLAIEVVRM
jgi:hypothetical protein